MIHDVDDALRSLLKRDVRAAGDVDISFDAPSTDWASRRSGPTINLYLYDIREDTSRKTVMYERVMSEDDPRIVASRKPPARFFKLSYLLTCWTQRPEDEHRLLSACLGCYLRYDQLPREVLSGSLADTTRASLVQVAQPPPGDRSISDIWTALGGELKPSLDLRVTAPFEVEKEQVAGPPVRELGPLLVRTSDGDLERPTRFRGRRRVLSSISEYEPADELMHEGAANTTMVPGDPEASPRDVPTPEVIGEEGGRWYRVREMPRETPVDGDE